MIEIKPNAFYTRADLLALFNQVGLDWDSFVARLQPRKVSGRGWWGRHIVDALDAAEELRAAGRKPTVKSARSPRKGKGGTLLDQAIESLGIKNRK